jgi:DNA-binding NtrC family response regulator
MARIVIVAGTDAGQDVAAALSAAGHQIVRAESLSSGAAAQGDVIFIEPWLYAAGSPPADAPVVLLTSQDALPAAVEAVKNGAYDLVRVPCTRDEVRLVANRALRYHQLVRENEQLRRLNVQVPAGQPAAAGADEEAASFSSSDGAADSVAAAARNLAGKPLADIEKQVILRTLEQFKGHRLRTAAALGIGVRTLGMKIKRWREEGEPIAGRNHGQSQQQRPVHVDVS